MSLEHPHVLQIWARAARLCLVIHPTWLLPGYRGCVIHLGPGWWEQNGLWMKPLETYKLPCPRPWTHRSPGQGSLLAGLQLSYPNA